MRKQILGPILLLSLLTANAQNTFEWADNHRATPDGPRNSVTQPAVQTGPAYIIGADDVLRIDVWKEPELSGTVIVRPDGSISLPLINDTSAAGLTPMGLVAELTTRLKKYLANPAVTVIVTATNSRRVYVLGEVTRAGALPLSAKMTVLQALSSSGGFSEFANLKHIYVLRDENGTRRQYPFNYKDVVHGKHPEQNIQLKPGDTVVVP